MTRRLFGGIASGLGIAMLAMSFVSLPALFFGVDPSAGAGFMHRSPALSVNRELKGDRLLIAPVAASRRSIQRKHSEEKIPVGCDASFSPISAPQLAFEYGRCMT